MPVSREHALLRTGITDPRYNEQRRFFASTTLGDSREIYSMKIGIQSLGIVILTFVGFALSDRAKAVVPPPDGGYPNFNTAEGNKALFSLTTGAANTAVGWFSLFSNTDGSFNTGVGAGTLVFNVGNQSTHEGEENTAIGTAALLSNTTGSANTAVGVSALLNNNGVTNTAIGSRALSGNTTGSWNTANGYAALIRNTTGEFNTAIGVEALISNDTGSNNTAIGGGALAFNETGLLNTAIGFQALQMNTAGAGNTALGYRAGQNLTIGDDNICIANDGVAGDAGVIRIGRNFINSTYVAGISGQTTSGGAAVFVNSDGKLGTNTSSERFKEEIKPMGEASEAILALKPVSFRYKKHIDPQGVPQFGLVAEEVEKVNPKLIIRDQEGKPHMVRYEQINAMLLNEFLKAHRKMETQDRKLLEQEATIAELKCGMQALTATVGEQTAELRQVLASLQIKNAAARFVVSHQ